jgi:ABC-type transport system involved in multi-copper enzyme maturation permease subunit
MIWKIVKKEFLLNLMTFKFAVGTIVCVVLTAVFIPILAKDYQQRLQTYNANVARNEAELLKVKVYKNITPTIYRPPSVLSVFSEGLEKQIAGSAKIEYDKIPEISAAAAQENPYQAIFPVFDASLIFKIVIGVLALLVAYDAISAERERGTLRLMLSGTIARHEVLLAKLLAGLLVLVVPITITFIIGLIILLSFPMVELVPSDWERVVLMYLASLLFISAMYNLGLLFSCLTRRSAISLVLGLFLWIVFVVVVPNGSVYLAEQIQSLEPEDKIDGQIKSLQQDYQSEFNKSMPPRPDTSQSDSSGAFGHWYHRRINKEGVDFFKERYRLEHTLGIKYADKFWEIEYSYLNGLSKQKKLAHNISRISPISLYENVMSTLAGTDIAGFQSYMMSVKTYRNRLIDYVRSRTDGFSAMSLFSPFTIEQMEHLPDESEDPSLDLRDLPRFTLKVDVVVDIRKAIPDLVLLIFANVLFFALAFVAFVRYDVR